MKKGKELGTWATLARVVMFAGLFKVFGPVVATVCVLLTYIPYMLQKEE